MTDGQRIVERLGPDDDEIHFSGIFSGPNAEARVRLFDNLRVTGDVVSLTWQSFSRRVILRRLSISYHSPWWVPYQISCTVVNQARHVASRALLIAARLSSDLNWALAGASGSATSLGLLQAAISGSHALVAGTSDRLSALAVADATLEQLNHQVYDQSMTLGSPFESFLSPSAAGALYAARVDCAGQLASSVAVRSYVGRIKFNLAGFTG